MTVTKKNMDPDVFEAAAIQAAALMRSLSNEKRLMILCRLSGGEAAVGDMRKDFNLSQSAFSQHLAVLRDQDLVKTRREGQTIYYSIADPAVLQVIETLASIYCPEILL